MPVVKVMKGSQVVIPKELFDALDLQEGDYLEARVKRGQLVYAPKKLIDRDIAEALQDIEEGRVYGPFESVQEWLESMTK